MPGKVVLVDFVFPFSNLNTSFHSLLSYKVSTEKSTESLRRVLSYEIFFSCCFKDSLCLIFVSFIIKCLEEYLFKLPLFGDL